MRRAMLAVCSVLAVAGCGGGEEDGGAASPASSQAPKTETMTTTVTIKDFEFQPAEIDVSAGDKVTWSNVDSSNHNVIFDGDAAENIDNLSQEEKGTVTFKKAGTFEYVCSYHPGMEGSVVVQ